MVAEVEIKNIAPERTVLDGTEWIAGQTVAGGVGSSFRVTVNNLRNSSLYFDDLRFPATAINPPGIASDPDFDTTNGGYLFDAGGTEIVFFAAQLPHSWVEGTDLTPHVHWQKTTSAAGAVYWQFEYKWAPINEVMDVAFTTLGPATVVGGTPDTDTANKHLISSFGDIDATGKQISDMLLIKVSRIGGDGADTYGADARLLEFDLHYQTDGHGSVQAFTKT